jgi:hypothetical protein
MDLPRRIRFHRFSRHRRRRRDRRLLRSHADERLIISRRRCIGATLLDFAMSFVALP